MPTLAPTNFNVITAILGGYVATFGLVSYLLKEKLYFSESLLALLAGVLISPNVTSLVRPIDYVVGDQKALEAVTLSFTRLVLGVQLVIAGVQLPSRYLRREWRSLSYVLGPGMTFMWLCTGTLVYIFMPTIGWLSAFAIGACVTPTDPVLSNTIVKGAFADRTVPEDLQNLIVAESGTNDGLGYLFLFLPLYLIKFLTSEENQVEAVGKAVWIWIYETCLYQVVLGAAYGAVIGWAAKYLLQWAERRKLVDRESFFLFSTALALFIIGTAGIIGTDDVLACFIAGNTFTWDDWFRKESHHDTLQPTVDMLLNIAIFMWLGAVCPWHLFSGINGVTTTQLIFLGITVLLLRRPPIMLLLHTRIRQIETSRQALFVGFFGPIGVSAIFYLNLTLEILEKAAQAGNSELVARLQQLGENMTVIVWFLVICSVIVHGCAIPLGVLGKRIPPQFARVGTLPGLLPGQRQQEPTAAQRLIDVDDEP